MKWSERNLTHVSAPISNTFAWTVVCMRRQNWTEQSLFISIKRCVHRIVIIYPKLSAYHYLKSLLIIFKLVIFSLTFTHQTSITSRCDSAAAAISLPNASGVTWSAFHISVGMCIIRSIAIRPTDPLSSEGKWYQCSSCVGDHCCLVDYGGDIDNVHSR